MYIGEAPREENEIAIIVHIGQCDYAHSATMPNAATHITGCCFTSTVNSYSYIGKVSKPNNTFPVKA